MGANLIRSWGFAAALWGVTGVALSPYVEAAHECIVLEAAQNEIPASEYHAITLGLDDLSLLDGSLTEEEFEERIAEVLAESDDISYEAFQSTLVEVSSNLADGTVNPLSPNGTPAPPPMKLPLGPEGQPNPWKKVPGTPARPIKWVPTYPVDNPGGGQPGSSWDPENNHWDVDNGLGDRIRQSPDGTPVDHDNNPICPPPSVPEPFIDFNYDVLLMGAFVVVAVIVIIIVAPEIGVVAAGVVLAGAAS